MKTYKGYLIKSSGRGLEKEGGLVFLRDNGTKDMWNNRCCGIDVGGDIQAMPPSIHT